MTKRNSIKTILVFSAILGPWYAFATDLLPLPSNWLDMIATSSVPFLGAMLPITLFLLGIWLVGWFISMLRGR